MASTTDIIRQLEHEIELRRAEISTFQSIIFQLSGKAISVSKVSSSTEIVEPIKRAGRGRPRKTAESVPAPKTAVRVTKAPKVASTTKLVSSTQGSGKVGRPKVRKRAKGTVVDSVLKFLKRRKQFCESETIFRGIKSKHKEKSAEDLFSYLSVTLSSLKKKGHLIAVKQDENGVKLNRNYWGLNRWVTKEGSIKPEFYFNQPTVEEAVIAD